MKRAATTLALALLIPLGAPASTPPAGLDAARVGWTEIRLGGRKLFLTADATLAWSVLPRAEVVPRLREPPGLEAVMPGPAVVELTYEGSAVGRRTRAALLVDPVSGAAIQREQDDLTGRLRHRTYRFGTTAAYHWTRWPAKGEEKLPHASWTRVSEGPRPYGREAGGPVLEPTGLIYAIAAAPLLRPGDTAEFLVFQRRVLQRVEVRVVDRQAIRVDFADLTTGTAAPGPAQIEALRLSISGDPDTADSDDELELLGLKGTLELHLDPATRAPLSLSGNVAIIGPVTLRLRSLRRAPPLAPVVQSP
jgi:hypothetical protein